MPTKLIIRKRKIKGQLFLERLAEEIDLKMVVIPAGTYVMGAPKSEKSSGDDERPQHVVRVPSFCMGQTQVTQAQWREVAAWEQVDRKLEPEPSRFKGDNRPVEKVSWLDAKEFCARLSQRTGKEYRLPSEAEWEYACRAENSYQLSMTREKLFKLSHEAEETLIKEWNDNYLKPFYFGETITTDLANYNGNSTYGKGKKGKRRGETTEVGSFPANRFGLCDMHGNVWEWCEDYFHGDYKDAPRDGSVWINSENRNATKILRGGSWGGNSSDCRSAYRYYYFSGVRSNGPLGFRVVCSLPG